MSEIDHGSGRRNKDGGIVPPIRRKDGGIVPPISLTGLFGCDESDDAEEQCIDSCAYENNYENQTLTINSIELIVRQYSFHCTNANQVWPGTFLLADFITQRQDRYFCHGYGACSVLELGSATGEIDTTYCVYDNDDDDDDAWMDG